MANQTPIARWVLKNRERLQSSIVRFDWPDRYFRGVYDFSTKISVGANIGIGRGIDVNQETALEKSMAESIERYICGSLRMSSIGVSVSGENGLSLEHARHEALERYFFDEHRRMNLPFLPIEQEAPVLNPINEVASRFAGQNSGMGQLVFFKMATPFPFYGYVATIQIAGEPLCIGLALHLDRQRAIWRAFFEAMTNFANFRDEPRSFEIHRRQDPDLWHCNLDFLSGIKPLFSEESPRLTSIAMPRMNCAQIDISTLKALVGCPISPVKVTCIQEGQS